VSAMHQSSFAMDAACPPRVCALASPAWMWRVPGRSPSSIPRSLSPSLPPRSRVLVHAERGHSRHCRAKPSSAAGRYRQARPSGALPCRARVSWHSTALDTAVFPGRIATVTAAGELRLRAPHMLMAELHGRRCSSNSEPPCPQPCLAPP
jgi:hypothetical protein